MTDSLTERGRALEEKFFAERERKVVQQMKEQQAQQQAVADLGLLTGVDDEGMLKRLVGLGVRPESYVAFELAPLLHVAWGDGVLDAKERNAILLEALEMGVAKDSAAYQMLENWLTRSPNYDIIEAWRAFHAELAASLSEEERNNMCKRILERAERVARASGGFLGFGAVSKHEMQALQELESWLS